MFGICVIVLLQLLHSSFSAGANEGQQNWKLVENWPLYKTFGQISAVSIDTGGYIYVFHRGNRVWDSSSFFANDTFIDRSSGPIPNETIIVLDPESGSVINKCGSKMFFMPHGLTVDYMNNIWITDVARHQVFKFPPLNLKNGSLSHPEIILGQAFEPGNDPDKFCKPTDVAVDKSTGDFYVSDGYCNSRIIKFDKNGKNLLTWGRSPYRILDPYTLFVPHSLSISEEEKLLFVADRENLRTQVYSTLNGKFIQSYMDDRRIYSVAYSSAGGKHLFVLSNSSYHSQGAVTVYNIKDKSVVATFTPSGGFSNPHDVAVSADGEFCYVVELGPTKVWKFRMEITKDRAQRIESDDFKMPDSETHNLISKIDNNISAHDFLGGTLLAIGVVSFVIIITFLVFILHMYKKKARCTQYEMRRLILDDEEEVGIDVS